MPQDDKGLLLRLQAQNLEFVIIGGVCAALHGTSLVTYDLDICFRLSIENVRRIEAAVRDLHPVHRLTPNKLPFELTDSLASRLRNIYLQTDLGKLDCLSEVLGIGEYQKALDRSVPYIASYGEFRMLDIDALIAAKEAIGRERDQVAVRQLKAIKERIAQDRNKPKS